MTILILHDHSQFLIYMLVLICVCREMMRSRSIVIWEKNQWEWERVWKILGFLKRKEEKMEKMLQVSTLIICHPRLIPPPIINFFFFFCILVNAIFYEINPDRFSLEITVFYDLVNVIKIYYSYIIIFLVSILCETYQLSLLKERI